ncbi:MAG: hypothetical protein EOQ64_07035 [Mesorhizobium sp.]|uniref:hypothetical protein n=1 Tax=Mesorhizobium sp. TaxID=1871066 RepID=UPI000FE5046F|nr:hypothetical protein [Mesorhizobium sp.]RWG58745.1 MAG: hypothetical protein EOQ64_07035 [Mesorhizobium sp.]
MTAPERARSTLLPSRTACSALMALLALALVSFTGSGNPGILAPASDFLVAGGALPAQAGIAPPFVAAPLSHPNQPRAPPTA